MLDSQAAGCAVDFIPPSDPEFIRNSHTHPGSPARVALLLNALLDGHFDALVLDASSLPTQMPSGLVIGAVTRRITPCDALISSDEQILDELPDGATVAADSHRRRTQMMCYRPELHIVDVRGSLDSMIQKIRSGVLDAAVVAAADMERLGRQDAVVELLTNSVCVPAAGQGALSVIVRSAEAPFRDSVQQINDARTSAALRAEWSFLEHLGVEDTSLVGVLGTIEDGTVELDGVLAVPDVNEKIRCLVRGAIGQEEELGEMLACEILDAGGREVLSIL